jgi:hypothetical protein
MQKRQCKSGNAKAAMQKRQCKSGNAKAAMQKRQCKKAAPNTSGAAFVFPFTYGQLAKRSCTQART